MNSYKLTDKVHNGYIFAIVTKRMYGLPQAGSIAHNTLVQNLVLYGYYPKNKYPRSMDT